MRTSIFVLATKAEGVMQKTLTGRMFLLLCALSSPVDFALDVRMGSVLLGLGERTFAALLFMFLYLSLRLQLLLFLMTTARPVVDAARKFSKHQRETLLYKALTCCLEWPVVPEITVKAATVAWIPFGLQIMKKTKCFQSFLLEIAYAPFVLIFGPFIILYGTLISVVAIFSKVHFYRLAGPEQVRRVRAIVISAVSTSYQAVPQLIIQATVYAVGSVQLTPHTRQIVVASMSFSVLSLVRSIMTIMASYHKILFTLKRINRDLDETTFNIILHECGDLATSGDSVRMRFDSKDSDDNDNSDHSLRNLREFSLAPPDPNDPFNISFRGGSGDDDSSSKVVASDDDIIGPRHARRPQHSAGGGGGTEVPPSRDGDFVDILIDDDNPSSSSSYVDDAAVCGTADHDDDDDVLAL